MTLFDKLKVVRDNAGQSRWAKRISAELSYLSCLSSVEGGRFDELIETGVDFVLGRIRENGAVTKQDTVETEIMLASLSPEAKKIRVLCAAHAHIDMNWMWGFNETAAVTVDTFRTMLDLMNEYPDFKFSQSQASTYKIIEENAPEMIDEIKRRVHEGRWELAASTWVECDKNMPNGESLSRHILYTKRYLAKLFDIDPDSLRLDFEPDTFGHNISIPEICQSGGVDYYYHCRGNDLRSDIYRWRGLSGKELIVFRDPHFYGIGIDTKTFDNVPLYCKKNGVDTFLYVYGVGDHGGGPTRADINAIIECASFPLYPTIKFGTYAEFFAEMERFRDTLPVVEEELNFIFTGCYTTQSRIKMANRISEDRAYEAEFYSSAARAMTNASPKNSIYERAWKNILFNHFHDILPGSGVVETREYALGKFQDALAAIGTNASAAMRDIANNIDLGSIEFDEESGARSQGGGVGYSVDNPSGYRFPQTERGRGRVRVLHLFNSTMYDRHEPVEVTVWDYNYDIGRAYFTDSEGKQVQSEVIADGAGYWGHNYTKFLIDAKIPAFGYSTYILRLREYESVETLTSANGSWDGRDHIYDREIVLENSKIRAVFDPYTLAVVELVDKVSGETVADRAHPTALFRYIIENPKNGYTAWRVGPYMNIEVLNSSDKTVRLVDCKTDGMRRYVRYHIDFSSSKMDVTAELRGESSVINFHVDLDWHEIGNANGIPQLNFTLPVAYKADKYMYDIPFATIEREDLAHDVPGNSFMRIGDGERAAFIVTESKYGFRGHDNSGSLTLVRSSYDPDPYPELGIHRFSFGVGICSREEQKEAASVYCHPISSCSGVKHEGGLLPLSGQAMSIESESGTVMTSCVKCGEDGGYVVRLGEYAGVGGVVRLKLSELVPAADSATLVDITERHELSGCELKNGGREIVLEMKPYTIATVLIK